MDVCSSCNCSFHDSIVAELEGKLYKSCPSCSVSIGQHIFYRYEDFGMRDMGDGLHIVQSWCPGCRSKDGHTPDVCFTC
ncbi:hypothetical protein F0L16_12825 [Photorhabdus heterorhabditis]|uniref:Uncharacterized protein n=2 Tax=Photorhabdus TaxID=29487 RepID=A0A5B0WMW0_9GAMM|nr:hypothetical protein F0L16_12825 [Photorhabdus heterorhabditis]NHB91056.1 hypothetical protein [Photorhabdus cinerea]